MYWCSVLCRKINPMDHVSKYKYIYVIYIHIGSLPNKVQMQLCDGNKGVTIYFDHSTLCIVIHNLWYICDTRHFTWAHQWDWDSQWQPGMQRPVIRSTARSWLLVLPWVILKAVSLRVMFFDMHNLSYCIVIWKYIPWFISESELMHHDRMNRPTPRW